VNRVVRPRILLALLLGGLLVLSTGVPEQAGAAPAAEHADSSADDGRTVSAYLGAEDPDRVVRVFSVKFWARAGERRYVTSRVLASQPASTSDSLLMASVSVSCSPGDGVVSAGATQNVMRGGSAVFTPRFVYVVPRTGMVGCVLVASGLRPRPAPGAASSNVWQVASGSYLSVSEPMGWWPTTLETGSTSRVVQRGERWTPIASVVPVGSQETSFELTSDHKVTTCSAVGGSRDSTTAGRELCDGRVSTRGSKVRLVVSAVQLDSKGNACAAPQTFTTTRTVWPDVHHAMVFSKSVVQVSKAPSCQPRFAIRGSLEQVGGADIVIHAPSERTSVLRH
jgi:hypothetical protein